MDKKTVYEKLQDARALLVQKSLKKSGSNKFANYNYYELNDFVPEAILIFKECKLCPVVTTLENGYQLKIYDSENPTEFIEFFSKDAPSELKGALPIQSLGAMQTYQRRYLYLMAMDITEHEAIDAMPPTDKEKEKTKPKVPDKNMSIIEILNNASLDYEKHFLPYCEDMGIDKEDMEEIFLSQPISNISKLTTYLKNK